MRIATLRIAAVIFGTLAFTNAQAQEDVAGIKVSPATYIRAETDRQFAIFVKMAGGVNRLSSIGRKSPQGTKRLDAGPATSPIRPYAIRRYAPT